ncbi:MAG: hypothetical protein K0R17_2189 [Rariglobus sp.]|jgi:hypothetical protein|nr:hypothetical protein [Rariglobus sp.]
MKHPLLAVLFALACPLHCMHAGDVKLTPTGFAIDANAAGVYVMKYPALLNPNDGGLKPENITIKEDGSGATMTYSPSGKLVISKQADGSWSFHFTEIPPDRVKFAFSLPFSLSVIEQGARWSFDGQPAKPFPASKGEVRLKTISPSSFVFQQGAAGFTLTYINQRKTFTMLGDNRVYGKAFFSLGHILYFPGKKHVPEIDYSIKIDGSLPAAPTPAPSPAVPVT